MSVWLYCTQQVLALGVLLEGKADCVLKAEVVSVGALVFVEEQLGGEAGASWAPRPGKPLSAAAVALAECPQENPVNLEAQEFLMVLGLV